MAKYKETTKQSIIDAYDPNMSLHKIAVNVGVSKTTVFKVLKDAKIIFPGVRSGPQLKFSVENQADLTSKFLDKTFGFASDAVKWAKQKLNIEVSDQCVRNVLKKQGINSYKKLKKPCLSSKNIEARLAFANKHKDWDFVDWEKVLFSDESKYNLHGGDGNSRVWCRPESRLDPANVQGTKKFGGGNVMVWGVITSQGVGKLLRVSNKINSSEYCATLYDGLIGTLRAQNLKPSNCIFQQDNAPCHTSKETKEWLNNSKVGQMEWPANSPDLNPIEHVWNFLNKQIRKKKIFIFNCR